MYTNPDFDHLQSELEACELATAGYVGSILRAAKAIPEDKWNWSFSERTPSPREICEHTFLWMWSDRQQMTILDRSLHQPTPNLPETKVAMIEMLQSEADEWRRMIRSLSPEQLLEKRETYEGETRNLRSFLFHIGQNNIYKAGQIWMLAFELGIDADGPYNAPYPNQQFGLDDESVWPSPRN